MLRKGSRELQGLGVMVTIGKGETVESEFGAMVDVLYQWHQAHGQACAELALGFVAPQAQHEAILTFCFSLIQNEAPLHSLFVRLGEVNVFLATPEGEGKEFTIRVDESESSQAA